MTEKPQITNLDEAKAALDDEIKDAQFWVDFYGKDLADLKAKVGRYEDTMYRLKAIRRRMDPPEVVEAAAELPADLDAIAYEVTEAGQFRAVPEQEAA